MSRSIIATSLTVYAFWTLGGFVDYAFGISSLPVAGFGLILALFVFRSGRTQRAGLGQAPVSGSESPDTRQTPTRVTI